MCFASNITNGGNTWPAALPHATIVICLFLPGDWYRAFFVPFIVTTFWCLEDPTVCQIYLRCTVVKENCTL